MNNTKLTTHQNQQITEALCRMALAAGREFYDADADSLRAARRALVIECEEVNLATSSDSLAKLNTY